jgi:excisionase family DNA binding protein
MNRTAEHGLSLASAPNGQADALPAPEASPAAPLLIDLATFASLLAVSRRHLERLLAAGEVPVRLIKLGRAIRFSFEECRSWARSGCPREGWSWPSAPEQRSGQP